MLYKNDNALSIKELATEVFENTDYQTLENFIDDVRSEGSIEINGNEYRWKNTRGFSLDEDFTVDA